jgi:hypothetical protein
MWWCWVAVVATLGCSGGRLRSSDDSSGGSSGVGGGASASCDTGCVIDGQCVLEGGENPENSCEVCHAKESKKAWSSRPDGATCSDGLFCTSGDVCAQGECKAGEIEPCNDGVDCNGDETCLEDEGRCELAAATCSEGKVCDLASDKCTVTCAGCVIAGVCYAPGSPSPENACEVCQPEDSKTSFTVAQDGALCDDGTFCNGADQCVGGQCVAGETDPCEDGVSCNGGETCNEASETCSPGQATCGLGLVCVVGNDTCAMDCAGCTIDGICYADGSPNPQNSCEICSVATTPSAFTLAADGTSCDNGVFCDGTDLCQAGLCTAPDANPCDDGVACNGNEVCKEETNNCGPGQTTCGDGLYCVVATDSCDITCSGCVVDGICYANGSKNPANVCEVCVTDASRTAFTALGDGVACDNGTFCDGTDTCQAGVCTAPDVNPCDDGVACNGGETCNEGNDSCSPGASTCENGLACVAQSDSCEITCAGCVVDGVCYAAGSPNPSNACESCNLELSKTAFSAVTNGRSCDNGVFCDGTDTCQDGACTASETNPCNDGVACNGDEVCQEAADSCAPGQSTCENGLVCNVATAACEITCAGCVVEGVCYPNGSKNPANACEVCSVTDSKTAFSLVANGSVCDNGTFCDGTDTCEAGVCTAPSINPCDDGVECNGDETCNESSDSCSPGVSICKGGFACVTQSDTCEVTCAGCVVDGNCYAEGSKNPLNACESCNTEVNREGFSDLPNGVSCDNGVFCDGTDSCQSGTCTASQTNPCNDGVSCNGTEICYEGTDSCAAGTSTCGEGFACVIATDSCSVTCAGCTIDGVCFASGSVNPSNTCEACNTALSRSAFSARTNGTACSDGAFCNGMDTCQAGVCTGSGVNPCNDGVACNGVESCNESGDSCAPGTTTCGPGTTCNVETNQCASSCNGCSIDGACYPDGVQNPANSCESCNVEAAPTAWTLKAQGAACGYNATCQAGSCECAVGYYEVGGYCSGYGIEAANETWSGAVYATVNATMPKVNLLANDVNHFGEHSELSIVAVQGAVNGAVSISGVNVIFNGTAPGPASFVYVVQAGTDPSTRKEITVSFTVSPAPSVIAVSDSRSVQQGDTLPITAASLLANDVGTSLTVLSVQNPVSGTVNLVGTAITFVSTGVAGEPAQFEYTIKNGSNVQSTGVVYITATPLPGVNGYIYDDYALFDSKRTTYSPPTIRSIFDTWGRFDNNTYFAPGATLTGTAAAWSLIADEDHDGNIDGDLDGDGIQDNKTFFTSTTYTINGDINGDGTFDARFMQRNNSSSINGFVSPESYENYNHEATLWSVDIDDDMVGVLIAYTSGGTAGTLHVDRTAGGYAPNQGWGLVDGATVLVNFGINGVFTTPGGGWGGKASRIKVVRQGDLITVYCTNWMNSAAGFFSPPAYNPDSLIEIDLASTTNNIHWSVGGVPQTTSRDLTRFRGPRPYGYLNASQALSSYIDVKFDGGIQSDVLVYLKDKQPGVNVWNQSEVWRYLSGAWTMTTESGQDVFGFVRPVTEPQTGNVYQIRRTEIEKL